MGVRSWLTRRARGRVPNVVFDDGWVLPHSAPTRVTVGNLDSWREATVDPRGLVTPRPDGWSLDWWVGADDRWHLPSREVAVRQRLVDDTPVVETAMRVPSGDVVQRVYAVREGDAELVVVEFENQSPLPVALALSVRPMNPRGPAAIESIELVDDSVTVNGQPALLFPKPPARMAGSTFAQGDVAAVVLDGDAAEVFEAVRCSSRVASAAFIWPLPHRQAMRFALSLDGKASFLPASLPTAQQVANGWRIHGDRGMRVVVPDPRLQAAIDANRRFLLVLHDGTDDGREAAAMADALRRFGLADVDTERPLDLFGLLAAGDLLRPARPSDGPAPAERVASFLATATTTWAWPDGRTAVAEFLTAVRDLLVAEPSTGELALCTHLPDGWFGQSLELHDAPTHVGRVSYAVRWHGDRPALLWEVDPFEGVDRVRLTTPGLDPAWSSSELRGDALLSPVLPPGTPVTLGRR